jgi:hypothetical protein
MTATMKRSEPVTASPRLRATVGWVGAAFTVLTLAAAFLKVLSMVAYDQYTLVGAYQPADLAGIDSVLVENSAGGVEVRGSAARSARVTTDVTDGLFRSSHGHARSAGELRVWGSCRASFATHCRVDHVLEVPDHLGLTVRARHGNIVVSGVTGPLDLDGRFGGMDLTGASGPVRLRQSFGALVARDLTAESATVWHRYGETTLSFVEPPREVRVSTQFGTTVVEVPDDGGAFQVTGTSAFGNRSVEVRTDPASDRLIHVDTRFGDVTIRYAR